MPVSNPTPQPTAATDVCIRTAPLGGSALSLALQHGRAGAAWLAPRPRSAEGWRARAEQVRAGHRDTDWVTALAPAIAATGRAADRLGRAAMNGVVVTTGQQPGLFGGPGYTWSKAIGALAMADALEAVIGMPVAPVFWAASDDADWMEAAVTSIATARGLETMSLAGPATDGVAMADVPLGDVGENLARLRAACGSIAHPDVLAQVESAYVPHATIGAAYVHLLRALLEPLGIAVLDASHSAFRSAADPFLRRALTRAAGASSALAQRTREILDAGFSPQVDPIDDLSLVFRTQLGDSGRERDRVRERIPVSDAARVAREADVGTLGANVLLRPVLERALLPTVTYLAGPGELAYFAQVSAVAVALDAEQPVVSPRWAGEVIDRRALDAIDALAIDESMLRDPYAAETEIARRRVSENVNDALERLRVATDTQLRAVRSAIAEDDAVVATEVVEGVERDLLHRLARFERRIRAGVKRRESTLMAQVAFARAWIRPNGASPERVLNLIPLLARFGDSIFTRMHAEALLHAQRLIDGAVDER
jgi:bacillithiol biosynthesis cysteine-adding enzyme BshC